MVLGGGGCDSVWGPSVVKRGWVAPTVGDSRSSFYTIKQCRGMTRLQGDTNVNTAFWLHRISSLSCEPFREISPDLTRNVPESLLTLVFGQLFFCCFHTHMTAAPTAPVIRAIQDLTCSYHCRCSTPAVACYVSPLLSRHSPRSLFQI